MTNFHDHPIYKEATICMYRVRDYMHLFKGPYKGIAKRTLISACTRLLAIIARGIMPSSGSEATDRMRYRKAMRKAYPQTVTLESHYRAHLELATNSTKGLTLDTISSLKRREASTERWSRRSRN